MEIVDGRSAGGMCAESMNMLGFPGSLFAIGAPNGNPGFFANALKNAIRDRGNEGMTVAEGPDPQKASDPTLLNAVPNSVPPHLVEGQSWLEVLQFGNEASQEILLTAVHINTEAPPIVAGDLMQAVVMQARAEMENPAPVMTGIFGAVAPGNEAEAHQWALTAPMPIPGGDGDVVPASIASQAVSEEAATGGLFLEAGLTDDARILGSPTTEVVGKPILTHEGTKLQDFPGIPVKSMPPIRGEPPVERTVIFPKPQVWTPEPSDLSLGRDGQIASTPGDAPSAGPDMTMAARDSILVTKNLGGQKSHEAISGLTAETFPKAVIDGTMLNVLPEHPTYSDAKGAVELGQAQLFDQLVQGVRVAHNTGGTEVLVHLKPDFLGRLSIRAITDDHGIRVEIRAENEVVRQVMQDNLADLRQWLADRDLAFNQLSILADTGWHSRREPHWPTEESPVWSEAKPETQAETAVESILPMQTGTIDYFA